MVERGDDALYTKHNSILFLQIIVLFALASTLLLVACTTDVSADDKRIPKTEEMQVYHGDIVEIGERFFATRINDIMLNDFTYYLGRVIRYEGLLWSHYWEWTGRYHHYVIRYTYGCCGNHYDSVGFELILGEIVPPSDGTWVEVTGILERLEPSDEDGIRHVRLRVTSLIPTESRGAEFVSN